MNVQWLRPKVRCDQAKWCGTEPTPAASCRPTFN
jgi:hypothetical protein